MGENREVLEQQQPLRRQQDGLLCGTPQLLQPCMMLA